MSLEASELYDEVFLKGYHPVLKESGGTMVKRLLVGLGPWRTHASIPEEEVVRRLSPFFDGDEVYDFLDGSVRHGIPLPRNRTLRFAQHDGLYDITVQKN